MPASIAQMSCLAALLIILLLCALLAGGALYIIVPPLERVPELSLAELFERQRATMPAETRIEWARIDTDRDATWALWAGVAVFVLDDMHLLSEEVHVASNPRDLLLTGGAVSPREVGMRDVPAPADWTYRPPHADDFHIADTGTSYFARVRYQEYLLLLYGRPSDVFGLDELQAVLEVTDEAMADFLAHSTLRRGRRSLPTDWPPPESGLPVPGVTPTTATVTYRAGSDGCCHPRGGAVSRCA